MADLFAHGTPAGDFHTWIKPEPPACPNCSCCSERLCELGRQHAFGCGAVACAEDWVTVRGCPCSAETTEGTEAHRAAQLRAAKRNEQDGNPGSAGGEAP